MPIHVVPAGETIEGPLQCERCRQGGQFPRLIADPTTSRRFNFFECMACGHPNWIELREK